MFLVCELMSQAFDKYSLDKKTMLCPALEQHIIRLPPPAPGQPKNRDQRALQLPPGLFPTLGGSKLITPGTTHTAQRADAAMPHGVLGASFILLHAVRPHAPLSLTHDINMGRKQKHTLKSRPPKCYSWYRQLSYLSLPYTSQSKM